MTSKTINFSRLGYDVPSCKVLTVNFSRVICVSGGVGAPESFSGFSDADGDYFN